MGNRETRATIVGRDETTEEPVVAEFASRRLKVDASVGAASVWTPQFQSDEAANDSDKAIAVPANTVWHILSIWVEFTSDATVGNRQLVVQIRDAADDVELEVRAGAVQAASLTRNYLFASSMADLTAFRDTDWISTPFPPTIILPAGADVRVYDNNAVAAAGDDMQVHLLVAQRSA